MIAEIHRITPNQISARIFLPGIICDLLLKLLARGDITPTIHQMKVAASELNVRIATQTYCDVPLFHITRTRYRFG